MTALQNVFERDIASRVGAAIGRAPAEVAPLIEVPKDAKLGDYAFPCFTLAKALRKAPPAIAKEVVEKIAAAGRSPLFGGVEAAGPYVNFRVDPGAFARLVLEAVREQGDRYGGTDEGRGRTVVIDYSSPNIAKRFHVGHLRTTVIGAALYRIFAALGYKPVGVNHLGDWGTQFGQLQAAWKKWGDEARLEQDPIGYLTELYVRQNKAASEDRAVEAEGRAWFKRLEERDPEARALWQRFRDLSLREFQRIYDLLEVKFDSLAGESFYEDRMEAAIERCRQAGIVDVGEGGALIVDLKARLDLDVPPFMLRKSDGATTYATRDLAAALYRLETYDPARLLYVVGLPQRDHLCALAAVVKLLGCSVPLVHVGFGHVLGMSTREGTAILLDEVFGRALDLARATVREKNPELPAEQVDDVARAVGIGAIVFNDLRNDRVKDVTFNWERMTAFEGDTGPYLQYTHVRLCGILRKFADERGEAAGGGAGGRGTDADPALLVEPETKTLLRAIEIYPRRVSSAGAEAEPSIVSRHLLEIAAAFNAFYHAHRVVGADTEALERARVALVEATRTVLANGLRLLGIFPLERM